MIKFLKQKNNKSKGFTLVETMVAISIFTMSILSVMSVLANGISNTTYAKKKITAEYLAQEGIEYIRNIRDTFALYSTTGQAGWTAFNVKLYTAPASCNLTNGCYFNADNLFSLLPSPMPMTQITLTACSSSTCPNGIMLYDSATGKYGYTASSTTINSGFIRKITVTTVTPDEVKITSTVTWNQPSGVSSVSFSENLYNWIQ